MSVSPPKKVLVTGARGQLAGAIIDAYTGSAEVLAYAREELDIANADAVMARVRTERPDVIINCVSFNHVDRAEDEPQQALAANAVAVRVLARAAQGVGATLVRYSTDFLFDGRASKPTRRRIHRIRRVFMVLRRCLGSGLLRRRLAHSS